MRTLILAVALVAVVGMAYAADVAAPQTAAPALVSTMTGTVEKIDGMKVTVSVKAATMAKAEEKVIDITGAKVEGKLAVGAKVMVTETAGKVTMVKVEEVKAPVAPATAPAAKK
jgi:hypothetical protein